ncbi:MAG: type I 3-dehydroquinate dehydratase [Planctomycetes bacterium]|nr:type I 3-dehydroquinate dehydratase [Planctomycetota bacterium]
MTHLLCAALVDPSPEDMLASAARAALDGADLVEFRMDALRPAPSVSHVAFLLDRSPLPAVVTCRSREQGGSLELPRALRLDILLEAVRRNSAYVDVEWPGEPPLVEARRSSASNTRIISSFHDFDRLPPDLPSILEKMESGPADVVKAAVACHCASQSALLLDLVSRGSKPRIVIGMGLPGLPTRVLGPLHGAEFTFAALDAARRSAPGQPSLSDMLRLFRIRSISPATRIIGVVGNPLGHSLSPLLHNTVFRILDIDAVYLPFEVTSDPADFVMQWSSLHRLDGLSVTIPHKSAVMKACSRIDEETSSIGAANTLYPVPGVGFAAANTDAPAITDVLKTALGASSLRNKSVLVLGAGGAARAAVYGLASAGCDVALSNRTGSRSASLAADFHVRCVPWASRASLRPDILVNMTSVGMHPDVSSTPIDASALSPGMLVFDAVYNPLDTRLLREAAAAGAVTVPGTEMFLRQAARQLKLWLGIDDPPLDDMRRTMLDALHETS